MTNESKKRLLILGGTGFIGSGVVRRARELGHDVTSLSRREGCDLRDALQAEKLFTAVQPHVVINCAADVGNIHYLQKVAADNLHNNLSILSNVFHALRHSKDCLLVNPIASCAYSADAETQYDDKWLEGYLHSSVACYGASRRAMYYIAKAYREQYGLSSVNWLVPNAYGPGDSTDPGHVHALNGLIIRMIEAQRKGDAEFVIWGTGKPIREWGYVGDIAEVLVRSIEFTEQLEPINIAQRQGHSVTEIAALAAKALGYDAKFVYDTSFGDGVPVRILDDRRFRQVLPDFQFTPLETGIAATVADYLSRLHSS